jgi:hypothetical protein
LEIDGGEATFRQCEPDARPNETEFDRVIDIGINSPQSVGVAPEDRALQGCNSMGPFRVACGPGKSCRSKSKAKNPKGVRVTESPDSINQD